MLEIRTSVDGLYVKASELQGDYTELLLEVEGISATVSAQDGRLATLELTVDGIETTVSGKIDGNQAQTLINQSLGQHHPLRRQRQRAAARLPSNTAVRRWPAPRSPSAAWSILSRNPTLSTAGQTTINGGNIKTGVIDSTSGYTHLDLAAGDFRVGTDNTTYVHIYPSGIDWRGGTDADGATARGRIQATDDHLWITSDTRYQMLGWQHEASGALSMPGGRGDRQRGQRAKQA